MTMNIGEAAAQSGVPAKTIRYYEAIGLLGTSAREANFYRVYSTADVAMLRFVGRARRLGLSIQDLRSLVALYRDRDRSNTNVTLLALQHLAQIDHKLAELQSLRRALTDLVERCHGDQRPECPVLDGFRNEAGGFAGGSSDAFDPCLQREAEVDGSH